MGKFHICHRAAMLQVSLTLIFIFYRLYTWYVQGVIFYFYFLFFTVIHSLLYVTFHMDTPNTELLSAAAISTGQLESPILPLINVFIQEAEYAVLSALQHPLHNNFPKKSSPKILCKRKDLSQICGPIQFWKYISSICRVCWFNTFQRAASAILLFVGNLL